MGLLHDFKGYSKLRYIKHFKKKLSDFFLIYCTSIYQLFNSYLLINSEFFSFPGSTHCEMVPCLRTSSSSLQGQRIISCVFLGSSIAGFLLLELKLFGSRFCKLSPGLRGHIREGLLLTCSSVWVDVGACACTCVCTCVEAEIGIRCLLWLLSSLYFEAVSHLNAKLTNSDSPASQLVLGIPFFTSQMPSLQVGYHAHTTFMLVLEIQTLLLVVSKPWVQSWAKCIHSYIITYIHTHSAFRQWKSKVSWRAGPDDTEKGLLMTASCLSHLDPKINSSLKKQERECQASRQSSFQLALHGPYATDQTAK